MEESVDISMAMRLSFKKEPVGLQLKVSIVVGECWHFFLSEEYDLVLFESEEVIFD